MSSIFLRRVRPERALLTPATAHAPFGAPQRLPAKLLAASAALGHEGCIALQDGTIRCTERIVSVEAPPLREVAQDGLELAGIAEDGSVVVWLPYEDVLIHHRPPKPAVAIDTNGVNTCFALKDGSVQCALPETETQTKTLAINPVKEVTDVADLVVGGRHLCVLDTRGQVLCWGDNGQGQCGVKSQKPYLEAPALVPIP